jgi:hypothetical protein
VTRRAQWLCELEAENTTLWMEHDLLHNRWPSRLRRCRHYESLRRQPEGRVALRGSGAWTRCRTRARARTAVFRWITYYNLEDRLSSSTVWLQPSGDSSTVTTRKIIYGRIT